MRLGGDPETTDQPGDQKPENDVALENIYIISVTAETFHEFNGWLNEVAPSNILCISVTTEVSQELIFPLNDVAPANVLFILVTEDTSHEFNG